MFLFYFFFVAKQNAWSNSINIYIEVSFRCIVVTLEITTNQHVINMKELYYEAEMQRKQAIGLIVISQDNKVFKKKKKNEHMNYSR